MTTETIFGDDKPATTGTVATPTETEDKGLFAALVGDTQKYKSAEELAKAYTNADAFIATLKEENKQLREQAARAKTLDEVLERINQPKEQTQADQPVQLSETTIADLVERTLTGRETKKTREANLLQADKLMKEKFGSKAGEVFKQKASTTDLQRAYMDLASQDPSQFVALFATTQVPQGAAVDQGSVSGVSLPSAAAGRENIEGTKEWAKKIRKDKPDLYWSSDFQAKLQEATIKNPNLYFGN